MKKRTLFFAVLLLWGLQAIAQSHRLCGAEILKESLIRQHPAFAIQLEQQRASYHGIAARSRTAKTAATTDISPVPVVFHFVIDSAQLVQIGGTQGIEQRIDSQIAVLNRDYNAKNTDYNLIPDGFKPLYGNAGISFGLAHTSPTGDNTPGYELRIVSNTGFSGVDSSYPRVKHAATGGLDAWDENRYLNVWCLNFSDLPGLLGLTVPQSFIGNGGGMEEDNKGVCVLYAAVGKRRSSSDYYFQHVYDEGRTLTHEIGHFFEIWHTWGDDGGLCPWNGGNDDGIDDTPPQADATYGNPVLPYYDACKMDTTADMEPYGIMCMNYMDYTDDTAMHLFTKDQVAVMQAQIAVNAESYALTQHPSLLQYPNPVSVDRTVYIFPIPATNLLNISFDRPDDQLNDIFFINTIGQIAAHIDTRTAQSNYYSISLSGLAKGIYFVKCNFASGIVTRKILIE